MSAQADNLPIFITATDTGVGKTTVTAALILALQKREHRVGVMKPVETGIDPQQPDSSDTSRLRSLLSFPPPFPAICLYPFSQPLAPMACAQETGTTIDAARIATALDVARRQNSVFFVEGAGGVFTPLTPRQSIRDLIVMLSLPVLVVGRTSLGSVNHLLLTLEALSTAGIKPCGIVLNDPIPTSQNPPFIQQRTSTIALIQECSKVPVFGPLEFQSSMETHWRTGVENLANHHEIQRLADHLMRIEP